MKNNDAILHSGTKTIYLDIMLPDGTFYRQIPFQYCPLFPLEEKTVKQHVIKNYPSLANKKFNIQFSNNRVF